MQRLIINKTKIMNSFIRMHQLKPGDEIIVPKSQFNIVQHHVVYLGFDENGIDYIIENKIGIGVRLVTANDFFASVLSITKINRFEGTNEERKRLVEKALQSVGKPYNLINFNCEHFATELRTGRAKSRQVETAVLGLFGALILGAILSD